MLLVFFLLGIVAFMVILIAITIASVLEIEIQGFQKASAPLPKEKEATLRIRLYFLDRIVWFRKTIPISKLQKQIKAWSKTVHITKIEKAVLENKENWKETKAILKACNIRLSKLNLECCIGTEDAILTSSIVTLLASFIAIVLPHIADRKPKNYHYTIQPLYRFRNEYKLRLDCIINVKMVHIISIIKMQIKKRRVEKHERTSNTGVNDYRYGQYTRYGGCQYHYRRTDRNF